ncbi:hypothetical protein [Bradyrhizobium sp. Tv2a-2]|uniref:hypothetical protein n=1 Tax=Bradyrhizobium sp. Tv2a-2 TaxID=113395 RepID=UPI000466C3A0|nr:hypothetical protein [Bradyrhizobium sp. Tv2a-2]
MSARRLSGAIQKAATVSASALAVHLDCSRAYISKLEAEGVIQRRGDGFPLDQSRVVREDDDREKPIVKDVSPKSAQFDSSPSQRVFIIFTRGW